MKRYDGDSLNVLMVDLLLDIAASITRYSVKASSCFLSI